MRIQYKVSFWTVDGVVQQSDRVVFAEPEITYPMIEGFIGPGSDYNTEQIQFGSCELLGLGLHRLTFNWANNDVLILDQPSWNRPIWNYPGYAGETSPSNLIRAEVTIAGSTREISDYYQLVYAAEHHNWFEEYLVILDPPIGDVHAVYTIDTGLEGTGNPEELLYLNDSLDLANPIQTSAHLSHTSQIIER